LTSGDVAGNKPRISYKPRSREEIERINGTEMEMPGCLDQEKLKQEVKGRPGQGYCTGDENVDGRLGWGWG
jgi:hypothetical protein